MMRLVTTTRIRDGYAGCKSSSRHLPAMEDVVVAMVAAGEVVNDLEVGSLIGYSPAQVHRLSVEILGESAHSFATRLRLERAAGRLGVEHASIQEAAAESGLLSRESFARAFTAHFGCAPAEFARRNSIRHLALPGYVLVAGGAWQRSVRVISRDGLPITFMFDGPVLLGRVLPHGVIDWNSSFRQRAKDNQ
jgi:AraC-like DNA-binding protein